MGGFDTMITERTKNVLIESAWFDPWTVRSMAKRHGMHTDASHRFERGADYGITPLACDRVAELILQSAGGELDGERIDAVARTLERPPITLRGSEVRRHLGIDIPAQEIERILGRLGFRVTSAKTGSPAPIRGPLRTEVFAPEHPASGASAGAVAVHHEASGAWTVQIPSWRLDVEREIDLLEELARIYGYNKFPNTLPAFTGAVVELPDEAKNARVRETMLALGYDETISITFISEQDARAFGSSPTLSPTEGERMGHPAPAPEPLALANPLSEEAGYMRTSLLPGLLNQVSYNLNRGTADVRLFEAGEVFEKTGDRHDERRHLGFVATGEPATAFTGAALHVLPREGRPRRIARGVPARHRCTSTPIVPAYLHPGRAARAVMDGETVAVFGQLHPEQAAARKLKQDVYLAEVMLDRLYRHALREPRYQRISKFPAVGRDFSFVFDDAVTWERIKSARRRAAHRRTDDAARPPKSIAARRSGAGKYSVLLHAEFQSQERTLRDDEVAQWSAADHRQTGSARRHAARIVRA